MAILVAVLVVIASFSVYILMIFQKRKIRLLKQQQELKENYEKEILNTQIEIRDQTMKDVGRELHDHIGQVLTVIKMNLSLLLDKGLEKKDEERLLNTKEHVGEVINDLRSMSKTLNGDLIKQVGLLESIRHELNRIDRLDLVKCHLQIEGKHYSMPPEKEFVVFRILQENLNNILKHSRCKNVFTKIVYDEKEFTLIQTDDGVGYDLTEVNKRMDESAGSGLINMQRRAELINATFSLNSQPLKGTQLSLKIENLNNEKN
jgi:two-component system, NarL family, sensor kinase